MINIDDFSQNLATLVKAARKQSGLSQKALAQHADVGKTVIYEIEHNKASIRLDTLLKVLNVLNIKVELKSPIDLSEKNA